MYEDDFNPSWWLKSGHVQTAMASLAIRRRHLRRRAAGMLEVARETLLDCGDGVRLHGLASMHPGNAPRTLVILIHGWEGSSDSLYLLSCASHLYNEGFDVFRLHLRDHGPSHHLNEGVFHSCRLDEAVQAVRVVCERYSPTKVCLAGFSLGGNFAARIAAQAPAAGLDLSMTIGVCPVLNPRHTLRALETGWPVYRFYFLRKWQRSLHLKAHYFPEQYRPADFGSIKSLMQLTEYFVLEHSDFPDLETYFSGYALVGQTLEKLVQPTHLILAEDDPIIPIEDLDLVATPPALNITRTHHGGHCGYLDSLDGPSWADREILRRLRAATAAGAEPYSDEAGA
ncbi:MAG: alpha/beta fold hydrolase [Gammaproteobacteria bacterium]|nr:alpha/beta fold hydrolase [Gammaproteobacteria bacterium]